jgi:hypothetical protein
MKVHFSFSFFLRFYHYKCKMFRIQYIREGGCHGISTRLNYTCLHNEPVAVGHAYGFVITSHYRVIVLRHGGWRLVCSTMIRNGLKKSQMVISYPFLILYCKLMLILLMFKRTLNSLISFLMVYVNNVSFSSVPVGLTVCKLFETYSMEMNTTIDNYLSPELIFEYDTHLLLF